jgi:hypothetical protein
MRASGIAQSRTGAGFASAIAAANVASAYVAWTITSASSGQREIVQILFVCVPQLRSHGLRTSEPALRRGNRLQVLQSVP